MTTSEVRPRDILRLAVPALGALVAEPLFLLADTIIVGRLGTASLAGLGIAGTILSTVVGVSIFLAFGTTARVARELGAGRTRSALSLGLDAGWLSLSIGLATAIILAWLGGAIVALMGQRPGTGVWTAAQSYLHLGVWGMPAMLFVLAGSGLVRGLQDTKITLFISLGGVLVNIPLNLILVHGYGPVSKLGIAGSALGTTISQWLMAAAFAVIIVRAARRELVSLRPHLEGISSMGRDSLPLFVRSVCLRGALLLAIVVTGRFGEVQLAAFQIILTLWSVFSYLLDALEIAGQALVGKHLGAKNRAGVVSAMRTLTRWSVYYGSVLAVLVCGVVLLAPGMFSPDEQVQDAVRWGIVVIALVQPMSGFVYALDGVLVGAGDNAYLGRAMAFSLAVFSVPIALIAWLHDPIQSVTSVPAGLLCVLVAYAFVFMGARAWTQWRRVRTDAWMGLDH